MDIDPKVFKQAFDSSPIGVAIVGADGNWIYVNDELCHIFGMAPLSFKSKTWRDFTAIPDIDDDQAQVDECLKKNGPDGYSMEKRYNHTAPGEWFWASLVVSVVRDDEGNFEQFISYVVPCSRPGAAIISFAWSAKNWKKVGASVSGFILGIGWILGWINSEKLAAIKKIFGIE